MGIRAITFDDIDGSIPAETVTFALYGTEYELDLSAAHRSDLEIALAPFIKASAHRTSGTPLALESGHVGIEPAPEAVASETTEHVTVTELEPDLDVTEDTSDIETEVDEDLAGPGTNAPEVELIIEPEPQPVTSGAVEDAPTATLVRLWAAQHGLGLGSRGPITTSVLTEYLNAHGLPSDTALAPAASTRTQAKTASAKSKKAAAKVRTKAAEKTGKKVAKDAPAPRRALEPSEGKAVRDWASRHGLPVNTTGPLPKSVTQAFAEAVEEMAPKRNKGRVYPAGIREWARERGYKVGNGKIDEAILTAYTAAQ